MPHRVPIALLLLLAPQGFSQTFVSASSTLDSAGREVLTAVFRIRPAADAGPLVEAAPYSAEEVTDAPLIASSGGRAAEWCVLRRIWRDSAGRERTEQALFLGSQVVERPWLIEIVDRVGGYHYVLDGERKTAHRWKLGLPAEAYRGKPALAHAAEVSTAAGSAGPPRGDPEPASGPPEPPRIATRPDPNARAAQPPENLGEQVLDGVRAVGSRVARPVSGGERPAYSLTESWFSPELQIVLLSKLTDPAGVERTTRLRNLLRHEPAEELLRIPPGYQIQDEPGPFDVTFQLRN